MELLVEKERRVMWASLDSGLGWAGGGGAGAGWAGFGVSSSVRSRSTVTSSSYWVRWVSWDSVCCGDVISSMRFRAEIGWL